MAEISYQNLASFLKDRDQGDGLGIGAVCLIHGEDLFVRTAFDEILRCILPAGRDSLNFDPLDGGAADIGDVVARMNTYSLLGGPKVVALRDARLFHAQEDAGRILDQARKAHAESDLPRAARHFLAALAQLHLTLEDMQPANRPADLPGRSQPGDDEAWIDRILEHCTAGQLAVPASSGATGLLEEAIEKGFPRQHHLIITTDIVDRRRSLFARIRDHGLVVDCSVPKGERKADKEAQEAVLSEHMKSLLSRRGKTMSRAAFLALCETTGFDPGVFSNNLEILVDYVGGRREIAAEDVAAVLTRTKKDPLFELTNAVADRDWEKSLFFLKSLLAGDIHGLQALAAIANQVRKLLVARDFLEGPRGRAWRSGCSYAEFQRSVMPEVVQHDRELLARIEGWEAQLADEPSEGKKKKKSRPTSDLILAKNPANAFPVYQVLKKSERFARRDLLQALEALNEADHKLKSSTLNARLVLERAILQICTSAA